MVAEQSSLRVSIYLLIFFIAHSKFNLTPLLGGFRCVPSQSTATIKLELLPLTDGIITLDSLQIDVKEKGISKLRLLNLFPVFFFNLNCRIEPLSIYVLAELKVSYVSYLLFKYPLRLQEFGINLPIYKFP